MKDSKTPLLFLIACYLIIGLISCKKEETNNEGNTNDFIDEDVININETEIEKQINFSSQLTSIETQTDADWLSVEIEYNLNRINFSFLPNQTTSERTTEVVFLSNNEILDKLTINQEVFILEYPEGALTLDDISYSTNSTIDDMPVTSKCMSILGFSDNYNLEAEGAGEIIIPPYYIIDGELRMVGSIHHNAFEQKNLTKVILPEYLSYIDSKAFKGNQLTEISFGIRLYNIEWSAFEDNKLTEVNIPNSVTTIANGAFSNNQLTKVTIGSAVTSIENNAFAQNDMLCDVANNSSVILTEEMFPKCPVGQCDIVSDYVFGFNNDLSYDETHIVNYVGTNTDITIPNAAEIIGSGAFSEKALTSVILPLNLATIESSAFMSNEIKAVTFNTNIETIGQYAFANNGLTVVNFKDNSNLKTIDSYAFYNCAAQSIVLPTNANPDFHHYEDSDGNIVTEISIDNDGYRKGYYACKEDGTKIE